MRIPVRRTMQIAGIFLSCFSELCSWQLLLNSYATADGDNNISKKLWTEQPKSKSTYFNAVFNSPQRSSDLEKYLHMSI